MIRAGSSDANEGTIELDVLISARASRERIGPVHDGRLKIAVTAPPVDGAANAAIAALIAKALGLAKSAVRVSSGHTSKRKTLVISGARRADVEALCR